MCQFVNKAATLVLSILLGVMSTSSIVQAATETPIGSEPFNHTQTGFVLRDVHTTLKCEQCHVGGIFKGTPKECAGCHTLGSRVGATPKPINHVQTTFSCDTCHVSPTSFLVKSFQHFGIVNGCASCHSDTANQSLGVVKINRATHITTFMPCENCHINTSTFLSARMDHTGITSGCANCHGGQSPKVVSQPAAHIATNGLDCGACHNTTTFLGATFSHSGTVAGVCGSCHGVQSGVKAKPALHIPTFTAGIACDACHTSANTAGYTSFLGAIYHRNSGPAAPSPVGVCSTCHNGAYPGVLGTSFLPSHNSIVPPPTPQCDTCHTAANTGNYSTFMGATFNHPAGVVSPSGSPTGANACGTCHNGSTAKTYGATHAVINRATTTCDSCHTTSLNTLSWLGAAINHGAMVGYPAPCANCHNGIKAKGMPQTHLVTSMACDSCHTNSINTLSWLGASGVNHAALVPPASGRCQVCHDGITAKGRNPGHIPVGSMSCDTGGCHAVGAAVTFAPGHMDAAQHAVMAATRCDVCHSGAYATQGVNLGGAVGKVSNHIPTTITGTLDCNTCHKNGFMAIAGPSGWATTKNQMNHNNAQGGAPNYCVTCHLSGVTYMGAMQKKSHEGASAAKDCSSSNCHKPLGRTGTAYTRWK